MSMHPKEEGFLYNLKKILNDVQINFKSPVESKVNIDMRNEEYANKTFERNEFVNGNDAQNQQDRESVRSYRVNSINSSSSISSQKSQNEKYLGDKMRPQLNKLKVAGSEYQIGRIEYRSPSAIRLSRQGSNVSLANPNEIETSSSPVIFYVKPMSLSGDEKEISDEETSHAETYMGKTDSSCRNNPSKYEGCSLDMVREESSSVNLSSKSNLQENNQP
jgi:hypothetical protein